MCALKWGERNSLVSRLTFYQWAPALARLEIQNLGFSADNVLGAAALAAGRVQLEWPAAGDPRTLAVADLRVESSRGEAEEGFADGLALALQFVREAESTDADGDPDELAEA